MGMLPFFPWLKAGEDVEIQSYVLLPYERGQQPAGAGTQLQEQIDKVLEPYRVRGDNPVERASLLKYADKELAADLTSDELDALFVFSELLAVSGLSSRRYFSPGLEYCNRGLFRLYVQSYVGTTGGVTLTHRRRDGTTTSFITKGAFRVHKPYYIEEPHPFTVDDSLLIALLTAQSKLDDAEWGRHYESIVNFNLANTDSDHIPLHLEAVFTIAAFERLLGVGGKPIELARSFSTLLVPEEEMSPDECPRLSNRTVLCRDFSSIRELWLRDFYNVRDNMAHGKIGSRYPALWVTRDHLLLSSFVYPLLLKCKLASDGLYQLSSNDQLSIDVFEKLACEEHTLPREPDKDKPEEFPWNRVIMDAMFDRSFREGGERLPDD